MRTENLAHGSEIGAGESEGGLVAGQMQESEKQLRKTGQLLSCPHASR